MHKKNATPSLIVREIRGLKTAWLEQGNPRGDIILFLHGFPDGPKIWDFQAEHFASRFLVVRPYFRGIGQSERSPDRYRYGADACSLDILEILERIDPKHERQVFVVGHDLGAAVAWSLAPLLGRRLEKMVIMGGLSPIQLMKRFFLPRQQMKSWYLYWFEAPFLPELFMRTFGKAWHRLIYSMAGLQADPNVVDPEVTQTLADRIQMYKALLRELPTLWRRSHPRLDSPVLVIWGNQDLALLPPSQTELAPYAKHVVIRILEGNHWVFRSHPVQVNRLIDSFFVGTEKREEKRAANSV